MDSIQKMTLRNGSGQPKQATAPMWLRPSGAVRNPGMPVTWDDDVAVKWDDGPFAFWG